MPRRNLIVVTLAVLLALGSGVWIDSNRNSINRAEASIPAVIVAPLDWVDVPGERGILDRGYGTALFRNAMNRLVACKLNIFRAARYFLEDVSHQGGWHIEYASNRNRSILYAKLMPSLVQMCDDTMRGADVEMKHASSAVLAFVMEVYCRNKFYISEVSATTELNSYFSSEFIKLDYDSAASILRALFNLNELSDSAKSIIRLYRRDLVSALVTYQPIYDVYVVPEDTYSRYIPMVNSALYLTSIKAKSASGDWVTSPDFASEPDLDRNMIELVAGYYYPE